MDYSAMRGRLLVAIGLPVAGCAKTKGMDTKAIEEAAPPAASVAVAAPVASVSAIVPASSAAPPRKAPNEWDVRYPLPNTGGLDCPVGTARCFPTAAAPTGPTAGIGRFSRPLMKGACPVSITVPQPCAPGASCDQGTTAQAPLETTISVQQSRIYEGGACCYDLPRNCVPPGTGRLLPVRGEPVARTVGRQGWCAGVPTAADRDEWRSIAAAEHASIASFARAALELLALGAPRDLVDATHRAALDELRHARIAYDLAGGDLGPAPLFAAIEPMSPPTLPSFARATFRDACVPETFGALAIRQRACRYAGEIARAVSSIADDEERHAELAWRTLAWAVRSSGEQARGELRRELALLDRLDPLVREVVEPCALALLAA